MIKTLVFSNIKLKKPQLFTPYLTFSVSQKPYYPIKKLDFSKNEFQCIYKNEKLKEYAKAIGISARNGFFPSGLYLAFYLAFLEMYNIWNIAFLGFTIGFGLMHSLNKIRAGGLFISEFWIHKSGKKFKVCFTENALKSGVEDLIKLEFDEENIKKRKFIKNDAFAKDKEICAEDLLILTVAKNYKKNRLVDIKLFMGDNSLEFYNDYLIALAENQKIMIK